MRLLLWLVALMAAAIGIAVTARFNPGNVVFFYPPHRIDLSLNLFVVLAGLLFLVLYGLARAVRATLGEAAAAPSAQAAGDLDTLQDLLGHSDSRALDWWQAHGAHSGLDAAVVARLERALSVVEARLGGAPYLAGAEFTAADIMSVFSLTTMRLFMPVDLAPCPAILAYLQRIGAREAYRRAMRKGDPDMVPLLT